MNDNNLHMLVSRNLFLPQVRELLAGGKDPNKKNRLGNTPLHKAAMSRKKNLKIVKLLLLAGADMNLTNNTGYAPLHYAAINRKRKMIKTLLQSGVDINTRTASGSTALHFAINNNDFEFLRKTRLYSKLNPPRIPDMPTIRLLIQDENIDLNVAGIYGETPLMWAVADRQIAVVKVLLRRGANPNASNAYGETPLHIVFSEQDPCAVTAHFLLQHGADVCVLDHENRTPIDILIDGIVDDESLVRSKLFIKMITFHKRISKEFEMNLEKHSELSVYWKRCSAEVEKMKKEIISNNLTIYDFLLDCYNDDQFQDLFWDIYKPLIDILMKVDYSLYICDILRRIEKLELFRVLEHNLQFQNGFEDDSIMQRIEFLRMYADEVSHLEIFDLILRSNITDE